MKSSSCWRSSTSPSVCGGCRRFSRASSKRSWRLDRGTSAGAVAELDKGQREYFLRQQLKAIQEELGEADEVQAEVSELRDKLAAIQLPEEVRKQVDRELSRLERLQPAMAEWGVVRGYLEWNRLAAVGSVHAGQSRSGTRPHGPR